MSLLILPFLLSATVQPPIILFVVIYGLDWVATVPPTAALCREVFGADGPVVYGWVFASHQIGASLAAVAGRRAAGCHGGVHLGVVRGCGAVRRRGVVSVGITRKPRVALDPTLA